MWDIRIRWCGHCFERSGQYHSQQNGELAPISHFENQSTISSFKQIWKEHWKHTTCSSHSYSKNLFLDAAIPSLWFLTNTAIRRPPNFSFSDLPNLLSSTEKIKTNCKTKQNKGTNQTKREYSLLVTGKNDNKFTFHLNAITDVGSPLRRRLNVNYLAKKTATWLS